MILKGRGWPEVVNSYVKRREEKVWGNQGTTVKWGYTADLKCIVITIYIAENCLNHSKLNLMYHPFQTSQSIRQIR